MCLSLERGGHDVVKDVPIDTELATVQSAKFTLQFTPVKKKIPSKNTHMSIRHEGCSLSY